MNTLMELTPYQKNIWNRYVAMKDTAICNLGGYIYSASMTNYRIWQDTLNQVLKKCSAQRLYMTENGRQYVEMYKEYTLPFYDRSGRSQEEIIEEMQSWMCKKMPTEHTLLSDYRYIKSDQGCYIFGRFSHLIMDGNAFSVLVRKVEKIYLELERYGVETTELDSLFVQECMEDQAKLQMKRAREKYRKRWHEEIRSGENQCIFQTTDHAEVLRMAVPKKLHERIKEFSTNEKVSTEVLLFAAGGIVLEAYSGRVAKFLGRNVLNRKPSQMETMGMYVNTQVVEVAITKQTVGALLKETSCMLMDGMRCAAYSFSDWKKDMGLDGTLFDLMISYRSQRFLPRIEHGEVGELENGSSEVPLLLKWNEEESKTEAVLVYSVYGWNRIDAERFLKRMFKVLCQMTEKPTQQVSDISIFCEEDTEDEKKREKAKWQYSQSVAEQFLENVRSRQEEILIEDREGKLTGKEILLLCGCTVAYLEEMLGEKDKYMGKGFIGITVPRSRYLPVLMMASMIAGYGFLPINEKDSENIRKERIKNCDILITPLILEQLLGKMSGRADDNVDQLLERADRISKEDIAYGIYTSGTTGKPKVALNTHEGLACRFAWMSEYFGKGGTYLQKTRKTFDVSIWELLLPLIDGGQMYVAEDKKEADVIYLAEMMQKKKITKVHFVPSVLAVLLKYLERHPMEFPELEYIFCSGEALLPKLVEKTYRIFPNIKLYNLYGPAECAIDVSMYECKGGETEIPIGQAVPGTEIFIWNQKGEAVPPGVVGEICIAGKQTGAGYLNAEDIKFIQKNGRRYYRTGDCGKYGYDGQIYFLGRLDSEIKVRGMRMNPEYIERELTKCPGVLDAEVMKMDNRLAVFYVSDSGQDVDLSGWARQALSEYRIPDTIIKVKELPVSAHGKKDRRKLEELLSEKLFQELSQEFDSKNKDHIFQKFLRNLQKAFMRQVPEGVKAGESVFDAGLTSLGVVEFVLDLERMGIHLTFQDVYADCTLEKMAKTARMNERKHLPKKKNLVILKKENDMKNVFICFPYAGGNVECFQKFAEGFEDKAVQVWVYCRSFADKENVHEDLKELAREISGDTRIHVMGYCGGAAAAFAFLDALKQTGREASTFWLCAAAPYKNMKIGDREWSIWDLLPAFAGKRILEEIYGGHIIMDQGKYKRFRKEIAAAQSYMAKYNSIHEVPTYLLYGENDPLTRNYKKIYKTYHKYVKHPFIVCEIPKEGHYFVQTLGEKLARYAWKKLYENT